MYTCIYICMNGARCVAIYVHIYGGYIYIFIFVYV